MEDLKRLIREVPDFPKPGILFYDITTLLKDRFGFHAVIDGLKDHYPAPEVDVVLGIEARGFIFAPALAYALGAGFVPVRKPKKLPVVLSPEEVTRLLRAIRSPKQRAILMTAYAAGLRVSEAVALRGRMIGENGKVRGRLLQSGELEPCIEARALRSLRGERLRVAGFEIFPDRGPHRAVLDDDEAPRLAQSHRRSKAREFEERFQGAARQWIAPETPDIAAPDQKVAQARTERIVEGH